MRLRSLWIWFPARGWNTSGQPLDEQERQKLAAEIERAYIRAPLQDIFFYLDAAWLNESRRPGGRPSVSAN